MQTQVLRLTAALALSVVGILAARPLKIDHKPVTHVVNTSSHGDHRLAMALTVAALVADGETMIEGIECTRDSFPGFEDTLAQLLGAEATA